MTANSSSLELGRVDPGIEIVNELIRLQFRKSRPCDCDIFTRYGSVIGVRGAVMYAQKTLIKTSVLISAMEKIR